MGEKEFFVVITTNDPVSEVPSLATTESWGLLQVRSAGPAKAAAVELSCRLTGLTGRVIGAHYGGISSAAVSTIRRKVRDGGHEACEAIESLLSRLMTGRKRNLIIKA
jgi:hypothetical protein